MKILYTVHQFFPMHYTGTEKFLLNLSMTMQRWGHKVKVLAYSFYEDSFYDSSCDGYLTKEFLYKGIPVIAVRQKEPPEDLNWGVLNHGATSFAEKIVRQEKPDLIHFAHGMRLAEVASAARQQGVPYVVTFTDFFYICPNCKLYTSRSTLCTGPERGDACRTSCPEFGYEYVQRRLAGSETFLRGAHTVFAPSGFLGSLYKGEFSFLQPKVLPYGIDFSRIKRNKRNYNGSGEFVILFAGQLDYHKGVHVLLDAFTRLKAPNAVLKLYGSGPEAATRHFREMAKNDPRVQFCGVYKEDQLGDVFGNADLAVVPSNWHENNTIAMREALASWVPCVVSNAGGMIEQIQDGVNGFIFRMGDADHLKQILERIIAEPSLLQQMKKNLHSYFLTTVEQEAFEYEQVYNQANAR